MGATTWATTWNTLLSEALQKNDESWGDVESSTLSEGEMLTEFDCDYGGVNGCPFTVWTKNYVYFPACYDGAEWVACVPRNPNGKPTDHIGGG